MDTTLTRHLPVATCIGCGARSHDAQCAEGCTDLPLDLVDIDDLVAIASLAEALEDRVAELRAVARALVEDDPVDWTVLKERARAAVLIAVPEAPEVDVIEGWGCPRCGRVDAPQPCLGICVRRPGVVADVAEYRDYAGHAQRMAETDRALLPSRMSSAACIRAPAGSSRPWRACGHARRSCSSGRPEPARSPGRGGAGRSRPRTASASRTARGARPPPAHRAAPRRRG